MSDRDVIIKILDDHDPEGGTFPGEDESLETFWGAQADALLGWLNEEHAKAWDEGYGDGRFNSDPLIENPYRKADQ